MVVLHKNLPLPWIPRISMTSTVVSVSSKLSSIKVKINEKDVESIFVDLTSSSSIWAFILDNLLDTETIMEVVEILQMGGRGCFRVELF